MSDLNLHVKTEEIMQSNKMDVLCGQAEVITQSKKIHVLFH